MFLAAHAAVLVAGYGASGAIAVGDVELYSEWARAGLADGHWVGLTGPWVYPVGALAPILLAQLIASVTGAAFTFGWFVLVLLLNAGLLTALVRWCGESGHRAAWWFIGFVLALGPVVVLRLDTVAMVAAAAGLLLLASRPALAAIALTAAAWVKVWPAVLIVPAVLSVTVRSLWRLALAAAVLSAVCALTVVGGGGQVFGFLTTQTDRGLQAEAVAATPLLWWAHLHGSDVVVYDPALITFAVTGRGSDVIASAGNVVLPVLAAAVTLFLVGARVRGADAVDVLLLGSLLLPLALFVSNKVGSPQYVTWLAPAVIAAVAVGRRGWRVPAGMTLAVATATQVLFPYLYPAFVDGALVPLVVLTVRNVMLVALLVWGLWAVAALPAARAVRPCAPETT